MDELRKNIHSYKDLPRQDFTYRAIDNRLKDYKSVYRDYTEELIMMQASRCQDCGVPFCHGFGCPLYNMIPDWNDLVYRNQWQSALGLLHSTNNFPEITGLVCPSLCEDACTLNVGMEPVTIRNIELSIIEKGFENNWVKPQKPDIKLNKSIAIVGSGPAGLFAAKELNKLGYKVIVFEKDNKAGGFLRYGIPDFKLEKYIIDRRIQLLKQEGIEFKTNVNVGVDIKASELQKTFDAVLLTCGSRESRDLKIAGRDLCGIHFATDYLIQSNKRVDGIDIPKNNLIDAKDKEVIIIGGGDTGADCIGTARRQGAKNIYQLEILPKPPDLRAEDTPWPMYAKKLRTSSSHKEGCERRWCVLTKEFIGKGNVEKISAIEIEWYKDDNDQFRMKEVAGREFEIRADLVLLAMGFVHPVHDKLLDDLGVEFDTKGNIKTDNFGYGKTSVNGVFAAGDAARGASLVAWAFAHAKDAAKQIDLYLKNLFKS